MYLCIYFYNICTMFFDVQVSGEEEKKLQISLEFLFSLLFLDSVMFLDLLLLERFIHFRRCNL